MKEGSHFRQGKWFSGGLLLILLFSQICLWGQSTQTIEKKTLTYKDTLGLDLYWDKEKSAESKPLIILVHGGGFSQGKRDNATEAEFCRKMAEQGYLSASISYRLTRKEDSFGCDLSSEKKIETFVAAAEDLSDAYHFIKGQEDLRFDEKKVILVGSSAGAETILNAIYMKGHPAFRGVKTFEVAGLISFAGAVINLDYIRPENSLPTLLFHGEKDDLVPYGTDAHHFCANEKPGYLILSGSAAIAERLAVNRSSYTFYFDPMGDHAWADEAYLFDAEIVNFIEKSVLAQQFNQQKIQLKPKAKKQN